MCITITMPLLIWTMLCFTNNIIMYKCPLSTAAEQRWNPNVENLMSEIISGNVIQLLLLCVYFATQ